MAEVIIGKQRNGPVGSKMLYFVKDYARFENLTVNDAKGDFVGVSPGDNLLSSSGDFSTPNPGDAMLPNSPMPSDDEAPF
jgi:replicative DNA helicase